jgi:uncharacterized membrane protein
MRYILNLEIRMFMVKMLSSILAVAVLSLLEVLSRFLQLLKTSGLKIGIVTGFIIQFPLLKRQMNQEKF